MKRKKYPISYYVNGLVDKVGRKLLPRYQRKAVTLFRYTNALGDALFLTTLAREVKKRNPKAMVHVVTGLPSVFDRNPDVDLVTHYMGNPIPWLGKHLVRYEHRFPWKQHLLDECARCIDIFEPVEKKIYIYPSQEDRNWAQSIIRQTGEAPVLISRTAGPRTDKKNWPDKYWSELIPELLKKFPVIEIGSASQASSPITQHGYTNLTGKTSLHQIAALMELSKLIICPVTGLLHLSSASGIPALCIAGGSEPALATTYKNTRHLVNRPSCADCYEQGPCLHEFKCLYAIRPETVMAAVNEMLNHESPGTIRD